MSSPKNKENRKFTAIKGQLDEVYNIGVRNGEILMKNEILKQLNRDWNLWGWKKENLDLCVKVLKKINRIKPKPNAQ